MNTFEKLLKVHSLVDALNKQKIVNPTWIQENGIPEIAANHDVILESSTGSGKTLAYLLPLIEKINFEERKNQVIVLVPTHELAIQVHEVINTLAADSGKNITSTVIMGDVNIKRQVEKLKEKPQFVIGSPGRILELIKMKKVTAHTIKTIVIDECDKLLDENNLVTVKSIIKSTLKERQMILSSATVDEDTLKIAEDIMNSPVVIKNKEVNKLNSDIEHMYIVCDRRDKILTLRKLMASIKPERAIAFINRSEEVEEFTDKLVHHNLKVNCIHGTFVKNERQKAMQDFKSGKINLLISSDLSSRGLDIEGVTHIFNADLPEDINTYVHRSGRTARGNNTGTVISIITPNELPHIKSFAKKLGIELKEKTLSYGELCDVKSVVKEPYKKKTAEVSKKNSKARRDKYGEEFRSAKKAKEDNTDKTATYCRNKSFSHDKKKADGFKGKKPSGNFKYKSK